MLPKPTTWMLCAFLSAMAARAEVQILPTPQYLETLTNISIAPAGNAMAIVLGPSQSAADSKMKLAAQLIVDALRPHSIKANVTSDKASGPAIYLWNWAADQNPPVSLNLLDRQTLSDPNYWGQAYVIRSSPTAIWAIGSSEQGVLFAATTLRQCVVSNASGVKFQGIYARDYPDFEFRCAFDWILNGEVNRWSMDQGQGIEAYGTLAKRKIDLAMRYKVNMILVDGFGYGLKERAPGYADVMRELNIYARARGIHLMIGGYGASYGIVYQAGPIYEEGGYLGEVFKNRESYPDGPTYHCMGYNRVKKGFDPTILGSCRSNDDLNKVKGEELRKFAQTVEPGAIYIHHEDFGNLRDTEDAWRKQRCERCRKKWPNDSLVATNGGAGGLSYGYAALVEAINSVKNPETGYDAARDCQIILVSPVYVPDSNSSEDWAAALETWKNIALQLPRASNVQICFREVFPQEHGTETWTEQFNRTMRSANLPFGLFLYFAGGTDDWVTDYPLSGAPAMNALFRGSKTIYNGTGDFFREPMGVISAEYSWNSRSSGFYSSPLRLNEATNVWNNYVYSENQPPEIFGPGKIYERSCNLLYGPQAGPIMAAYFKESMSIPDPELSATLGKASTGYRPMTWNRAYAMPSHWRELAMDSKTWRAEITNERYALVFSNMKLERKELHRRLARRWQIGADLNQKGAAAIKRALAANPLPESIEDLRFLEVLFQVYQPALESLTDYHTGLQAYFSTPRAASDARARFDTALAKAKQSQTAATRAFPRPVDPVGGEVGSLRRHVDELVRSIEEMQKTL